MGTRIVRSTNAPGVSSTPPHRTECVTPTERRAPAG